MHTGRDAGRSYECPRRKPASNCQKLEHYLVEVLVVTICAVLSGADTCVEIEVWTKELLDWLREDWSLDAWHKIHAIALTAFKMKTSRESLLMYTCYIQ